ncbi:UNVERIFIED_ORG: hypothetical protein FNL38_106310 [Nocardia globerula]|uniref:Uncharacterized protein n=1 Tax=Nocardia globerula TaxID=1818 RepID=A0A652YLN5_NOCGL|nr:hypothetical protein SZ00_00569 [Rhodococcus sp. AD45]PVX63839.1 hypothetical protein C8E04_1101 [Rhodococcus globerulus]
MRPDIEHFGQSTEAWSNRELHARLGSLRGAGFIVSRESETSIPSGLTNSHAAQHESRLTKIRLAPRDSRRAGCSSNGRLQALFTSG